MGVPQVFLVQDVRTVKGRCKNGSSRFGSGSPIHHLALEMTFDIAILQWSFAVMMKAGISRW
jgi:hypothetical protein